MRFVLTSAVRGNFRRRLLIAAAVGLAALAAVIPGRAEGSPDVWHVAATVGVNSAGAPSRVFCYTPGPACGMEDESETGYHVFLRPSVATPTRVAVMSRHVRNDDPLTVVRSRARVSNPRAPPVTVASGSCTKAEATSAVRRLHLGNADDPDVSDPVAQVLCGAFLGPGSRAMVASLAIPSCGRTAGWVVFRRSGATWQIVMERNNGADLDAVGTGIRETQFVLRPGDAHCFPTGGTRSRTWRWNGTRFVSGAWTYSNPASRPAPTTGASTSGFFKTPSGNIVCYHSTGPSDMPQASLGCGIKSGLKPAPPRRPCDEGGYAGDRVVLNATGRVSVPSCAGDPGALTGESRASVLAYGTTWSGGGLRCTSASTGLTCRNRSGHGFFLSRESWRSF